MQLRTIALVFSIVGLFYSGFVSALGLGEITLKSQFNQPLNAEIRLLKVRDLSKEEVFAVLASRDDFKRAGVDRLFLLSDLKFEVVLDNPVKSFIRVTSSKPITEPYLNFLVDMQWPSGRLLREYTLLLDLPVFNDSGAKAPVAAPTPAAPLPQIREPQGQLIPPPTKLSRRLTPIKTVPVASVSSRPEGQSSAHVDSYKVKSGDTLWKIAASTLADSQESINQRMIAIQQANPEAFASGNINRLRNGRVLRIPSLQEVADISRQQASSAVSEQNKSWSSESKPAQKAVLTSAGPSSQVSSSTGQPEGRLTLASTNSGQSNKGSGASGSGESLQNELAIANDELARSTRQNDELKSRITELEAQIETMESLIAVTSDQLKALQAAFKNKDNLAVDNTPANDVSIDKALVDTVSADDPPVDIVSADDNSIEAVNTAEVPANDGSAIENEEGAVATSSAVITNTEVVADGQIEGENNAGQPVLVNADIKPIVETPIIAEPTPFETPEPTIVAVPAKLSLFETVVSFLTENMLITGGVVLGLLVLLLVFLRLRRKTEEDAEDFNLDDTDENLFDLGNELEPFDALDDTIEEPSTIDIDEDFDDVVQAQTEDVVAEADIYVSLGQEDKAIELLQKEIQQNPDNADARLGLLKIYAKSQNSVGFDEQYAQLLPLGNIDANDQAMALRQEIENADPFDTNQYSLKDDGLDFLQENEDSDLDVGIDTLEDDDSIVLPEVDSDINLDDISLDLGDLDDEILDLDKDDSPSETLDTDFSLDIDDLEDNKINDVLEISTDLDDSNKLDDIAFSLELDEKSELDLDELSLELDNELDDLSIEDSAENSTDDLPEEIEFDLDLDLETDDKLNESEDDLDDGLSLDEELSIDADNISDITADAGLGNDFSVELDGDLNDLDLDLDEDVDLDLSFDTTEIDATETDNIEMEMDDDSFDLDSPPPMDIDMASLDQEIDTMTADMDKLLSKSNETSNNDIANSPEALYVVESIDPLDSSDTSVDKESLTEPLDKTSADSDKALDTEELLDLHDEPKTEADKTIQSPQSSDLNIGDAKDDDLDFLEESDEVSTKLDLAKAYMDMGDREGAEDILNEVLEEGSEQQKSDAKALLTQF